MDTGASEVIGPEIFQRHAALQVSADRAWEIAGSFEGIAKWYPGIVSITLESTPDLTRIITSSDGTRYTEVQLNRNAAKRELIYWLREGDLDVGAYVAHIAVKEVTANSCLFIWTVLFTLGSNLANSLEDVRAVVDAGVESLQAHFRAT